MQRQPGCGEAAIAKQDKDALFVIAAAYDDVDAAVADYEAVKALYQAVKTSHDFDAAVVAKNQDGKVRIVKKHEQPTRHGAAVGLGWGRPCSRLSVSVWSPLVLAAPPSVGWLGT
jgi:uncharacterized membrane protein